MKTVLLQNGWELNLTTDNFTYDYYEVFIDTKEKHPTKDCNCLIAESNHNTLDEAQKEFNRLHDRYTKHMTARLIRQKGQKYKVEITKGSVNFIVNAIILENCENSEKEIYIHYSDIDAKDCLFNFLEEGVYQRNQNCWVLLYKEPLVLCEESQKVTLTKKLEEKCIYV